MQLATFATRAHFWLLVNLLLNRMPIRFFCGMFFPPVLLHGVIPTQMEYPVTFALVKLNEV